MDKSRITREIKNYLYSECDMDLVGICPASSLDSEPEGHRPNDILPCAKSVVVFGKRLLNGAVQAAFRRLEDGNDCAESIYSTFGSDLVPNHSMWFDVFNAANFVERFLGGTAQPLSCGPNQNGLPTNTKMPMFAGPYQGGLPLQVFHAAVASGIAQLGWNNFPVTKEFGPRVQFGCFLTDLELEYDEPDQGPRLCHPENCHICSDKCPVHALPSPGEGESSKVEIAGQIYEISSHNVNACTTAALGLRNEFCGRKKTGDWVSNYNPTDEEIAEAMVNKPISNVNLDHYPKYFCNKCLLYCPLGNWEQIFGALLEKKQK